MRKETRMRKSSLLAPAPSSSFGTPYRPRPFSHLWAPQPTAFSKGIGSSSRPFSTALAQSPSSDPTWPSPWNSSVITSLATAFQRKAYSSSTVAANLDPMTTGAWSNLELDPRGVDHSVFEEASGEYEATLPATPNKAARSAIRIIASLINTDMAAATQAHEQLKEMGTEFDEKAAPVFARAAAQCAASPDQGQDAVRWLAAIPPKFSFSSLHQTQVAELFHLITFTLTLLKHGAENTDRARHLAMALHIVVARGLHLFRTGPGNELRRMIQRCFMDIVRYTTLTPSSTGIPPLAAVPPSWLEWKNLEDALFEREDDASLGADEHPALFRNRNALSPPLVSAKFRSSIFRNSIRVLAGSLRQRDALFWALRSSSIDEGASQDTDLDAFTVKVLVEETLKRPQDDLETMRLLDVLLSRLEVAKRDAVKPIDKMHFEGLLTAATNAYHASRETSSRKQSATGSISAEIKALVHEGDLRTAAAKACDVLRHRDVASFPNSSSLSKLLGALEANDLSDLASHLRQLMRSSRPGTGQDVITSVLGCIQLGQHSKAIATWRSYFADDAGVCDDVCSIALGIPPQELATQGVESAATSLGYKVWPRRGDVMVMLRALVGATIERYPASLEDLYQAWLAAAFDVPSPSTADQVTSGKVWRQGSVLIGGPCFDVFVAAFARTDKGTAVPRLMSIMQDMKDRGVQPTISTWTKLLETLAKEEVLREEPAEEPLSRTRAQGKSHSRFDGVEIDAEDIPAAATTTDSSPGWASTTMKLARSMGVGARDGAPEPHMPRASMITYVSLIGGLLAGPSMKRWRALGLCLDIRRHLQAEARRGVTFTTQDLERDPRAQKVLARVSWLESRCRVHGPGGQLESEGRTAGAV